jgi:hypothetical protein
MNDLEEESEQIMTTTMRPTRKSLCAALLCATVMGVATAPARAADHRDSPRITADLSSLGNLDILDLYAFQSPQTKANTVLIMTMSTDAGVISPATFNPHGIYEFKILNQMGTGKLSPDQTYQIAFSPPDRSLRQSYTVMRVTGAGSAVLGRGMTNKAVSLKGGVKVQAGLFDDPFFFDLLAFNRFKDRALRLRDPGAADEFLKRSGNSSGTNIPNNFFGGFNCIAIVLEIPSVMLQSSRSNTSIGVWARTIVPGAHFSDVNPEQFDRKGRPGINTVLSPDELKDAFNSATPETDAQFREADSEELRRLFGTPDTVRAAQVTLLLPDVLTLKTKDASGFDKLNGRRLADDVIDVELSLFTLNAVTGDDVENDSVFRRSFPYLGTPNPKASTKR